MDTRRLIINLFFFFLGILIPLLAFQSAFASDCIASITYDQSLPGDYTSPSISFPQNSLVFISGVGIRTVANVSLMGAWSSDPNYYVTYPDYRKVRFNYWQAENQLRGAELIWYSTIPSQDGLVCGSVPPEPITCENRVQDPDEDGVDCGGSCRSICDSRACEQGWVPAGEGCIPEDEAILLTATDQFGECPDNTVKIERDDGDFYFGDCTSPDYLTDENGDCIDGYSVVGATTYGVPLCGPNSVIYSSDDPIPDVNYTTPDVNSFEPGSLSIVKNESSETTDNGDGTSTEVITETTVRTENGVTLNTTKTTTNTINNTTGDVISSTTTIQEDTPIEDNPENYTRSNTVPGPNEYDGSLEGLLPEKRNVFDVVKGYADQLPIMSVLDQVSIDSELTECRIETVELAWGFEFYVDVCEWEPYLRTMGSIFLIVAQISALWIVIGGLRK